MKWRKYLTKLMDEHGEKWKIAHRVFDWLETAIMRLDEAVDSYMVKNVKVGDAKLIGAKDALTTFKDEMSKIDEEIAEYIYQTVMITITEVELVKDNEDALFKISEFKIPGLYHMAGQLFAILLLYYDELVKPDKK